MATTLTPIGSIAGTPTGGALTPTILYPATLNASATALSASPTTFTFANNGAMMVVVDVTTSAGGFVLQVLMQKSLLGFSFAAATVAYTIPSTIGLYMFGPFGPSNFNDANGLCWLNQAASAATVFIGVYTIPGALS